MTEYWIVEHLENSEEEAVDFIESQDYVELNERLPFDCLSVIATENDIAGVTGSPYITDYERDCEFNVFDGKS